MPARRGDCTRPGGRHQQQRRSRALERARVEGIPSYHLSGTTHPDPESLDQAILDALVRTRSMSLPCGLHEEARPKTLAHFKGRISTSIRRSCRNTAARGCGHARPRGRHRGGRDGVRCDGASRGRGIRQGAHLAQVRVPVMPGDTPETLAARVLEQEHIVYPATLEKIATGEIVLAGEGR